ncbi:hypothetical protein [Prochlorococcus marinus]|uniref:hypothetical protein n=1 Tax=Prochlorococcus marinus TaxID=1219 RepID=UPI0012FF17A9|nr:hypothetical protein [Prochlorococcus marinus]
MNQPSAESTIHLATCLNEGCDVGHRGVTTWTDNAATHLTSAWCSRCRITPRLST